MAAELNLGTNNGFGQACYDRVRDRAYQNATNRLPVTKDVIINERRLEFALEGQRYFDLIRQGVNVAKAAINNVSADPQFNVTFRSETLGWFPLPQSQIILSNGAMSQNPGW